MLRNPEILRRSAVRDEEEMRAGTVDAADDVFGLRIVGTSLETTCNEQSRIFFLERFRGPNPHPIPPPQEKHGMLRSELQARRLHRIDPPHARRKMLAGHRDGEQQSRTVGKTKIGSVENVAEPGIARRFDEHFIVRRDDMMPAAAEKRRDARKRLTRSHRIDRNAEDADGNDIHTKYVLHSIPLPHDTSPRTP